MENHVSLLDLTIRSSLEVIIFDSSTKKPVEYGSGVICEYRGKQYFITVAHVTNIKDQLVYAMIPTRRKPQGEEALYYSTGALWYFDRFQVDDKTLDIKEQEELDIAFCEINTNTHFMQQAVHYNDYELAECEKLKLNLDIAGEPNANDENFSFSGHVHHDIYGEKYISSKLKLECGMKYKTKSNDFLLFNSIERINDEKNYTGTSGAPIIADSGKLVGFVSSVNEGTPMIFAFSVERCKELIDYTIQNDLN